MFGREHVVRGGGRRRRWRAPGNITCAVCHDPHGSENSASAASADRRARREHQPVHAVPPQAWRYRIRRRSVVRTRRKARSLLGYRGGGGRRISQQPILSTHGSSTENPRLCAGCHVNSYEVTDSEVSGEFLFNGDGTLVRGDTVRGRLGRARVAGPCGDSAEDVHGLHRLPRRYGGREPRGPLRRRVSRHRWRRSIRSCSSSIRPSSTPTMTATRWPRARCSTSSSRR